MIPRGHRTGLEVIIDDIKKTTMVTTVNGSVSPVEHHIVGKGEITIHAHAGVASGIASPQVVMEGTVQSSNGATKGMVKGIEVPIKIESMLDDEEKAKEFAKNAEKIVKK